MDAPPDGAASRVQPDSDDPDGMPNEHYLYSLKDFQPFESTTYRGKSEALYVLELQTLVDLGAGIYDETKKWIVPFVSNEKLRSAFFEYTKLPGAYEKLNDLSAYVRKEGGRWGRREGGRSRGWGYPHECTS